jgi:hypothetical protein
MLSCALLFGCSVSGVDKPDVPSSDYVLAAFGTPTGSLPDLSPSERAQRLLEPLMEVQLLCGLDSVERCGDAGACRRCPLTETIAKSLEKVAEAVEQRRPADAGIPRIRQISGATGLLHVSTICDGWQEPSPDPAHGRIEFDVGFTGRGFDPAGVGDVVACELLLAGRPVTASGKLLYTFQPAEYVPFDQIAGHPIAIAFDGTIALSNPLRELALKAGIRSEGPQISFELPGNGTFIATFAGADVEVQGRDQRLLCRTEAMVCDVLSQP